jgi:hypothetical protein
MKKRIRVEQKCTQYFETWLTEEQTALVEEYMDKNGFATWEMNDAIQEMLERHELDIKPWDWDDVYDGVFEQINCASLEEVEDDFD